MEPWEKGYPHDGVTERKGGIMGSVIDERMKRGEFNRIRDRDEAPVPVSENGVTAHMDRLEKALTNAHELTERLHSQLRRVLQPEAPPGAQTGTVAINAAESYLSPMAATAANLAWSANALCDRLNALLQRIDL